LPPSGVEMPREFKVSAALRADSAEHRPLWQRLIAGERLPWPNACEPSQERLVVRPSAERCRAAGAA
jgi:hypothetical protein